MTTGSGQRDRRTGGLRPERHVVYDRGDAPSTNCHASIRPCRPCRQKVDIRSLGSRREAGSPYGTAGHETTSHTPLYVDGVRVATFHRINEGSLPVSGTMARFGTSVYPSWPRDVQRTRTILQSIDAEVQRMERVNVFFNAASLAKHIRPVGPGRRKMSAAGRARIAAAQRRRWGKAKKVAK
jgi:hypothetical protein